MKNLMKMNSINSLFEEGKGDDFINHSFLTSFELLSLAAKYNGFAN